MPPLKNHQCSARCDDAPKCRPCFRTAAASSPTTSRFGPILAALHSVKLQSYIGKPSWCSATGTTNFAPALRKTSAQWLASNFWAVNLGMKSLYPALDCGPYVSRWCLNTLLPSIYMLRGYHSLSKPGTEYTPQ